MATIAILTVGITGRLNSGFELARRLSEAGHAVVFASVDTRAADRVRAAGHPYFQLDTGVPEALRREVKRLPKGRLMGAGRRRRVRVAIAQARGRAALAGYSIDEFLSLHEPELLLVESELHESILYLLGASANARMALLEYHLSVRRVRGIPPLSSSYIPTGALRALRASSIWRWTLLKRKLQQRYARWYARGWDSRSVWERLARQAGTRLGAVVREDQWPMLYYPALPCVHLCGAELDFPHATKAAAGCVGPMIQRDRPPAPDDADTTRCRALLERLENTGRPVVACATGSILTLPAFVRKVIQAAAGAPFELVIATGRQSDPAAFGDLPPNVHAFRYIPQLEVLARASLFICHGGIGSIHESLLAGVPMIVYSAGHLDEDGNAARVAFHGLGLRGSMRRDTARDVRVRIETVLGSPDFAEAVANMRESLERYGQTDRLRHVIEALLQDSYPP